MPLTDTKIKALKSQTRPSKHSDGGGLHLLVTPTGSKVWRVAYRYDGKQKTLALGAYPAVSLAAARTKRDKAKALLAGNVDPAHRAKVEKLERRTVAKDTFDVLSDELLRKTERDGLADITVSKKRWLLGLARRDLGERPIAQITAAEILVPLRRIEAEGNYETARRLRAVIGQVFWYAIATARARTRSMVHSGG